MGGSSAAITCFGLSPCPQGAGSYGVEYTAAGTNLPGYRTGAATWTAPDGRFWMYGGDGFDSTGATALLDDLWVFDPGAGAHGSWTWMGGHSTAPPIRAGNWGTQYQPDPANSPGSRQASGTWVDSQGRFWLIGGYGPDSAGTMGLLNDLWVFDPALGTHGEWTWMAGSKTIPRCTYCGVAGVYGTKGQFAPANTPGSRSVPITWSDTRGRMWLFSGTGFDSTGNWVDVQDLWVFDPAQGSHGEWAWMGGPNVGVAWNTPGVTGTKFDFAPDNIPSYRQAPIHWQDQNGHLWLFGGAGSDSTGTSGALNELWTFDPESGSNGEWAWMGGDSTFTYFGRYSYFPGQRGVYGPLYQFGDSFVPGGRGFANHWVDSKHRLWLLGGSGVARWGLHNLLNDLWVFDPALGAHGRWAWMGGSDTLYCPTWPCIGRPGVYGTKYVFDRANSPGAREEGQTWTDKNGNLWLFSSFGFDSIGTYGAMNDMWEFRFFTPQTITFSAPPSPVTYGRPPITLSASSSSHLPVTFSLVSGPGQLSGPGNATLTITGAGTIVVRATQPGDAIFGPAPNVQRSILVNNPPSTVSTRKSMAKTL
jgi:hypothetical protein